MAARSASDTFIQQVKRQLRSLLDSEHGYEALHIFVSGAPKPWRFSPTAQFEFHEDTRVLIVRRGGADENGNDSEAPEFVFRLDAIVATQLI